MTAGLHGICVAVLAGGLGTRLASAVPDLPKVLAPVEGRPFIDILLDLLQAQGAGRVVLCLGHRADQVLAYLNDHPRPGLDIRYSIEESPQGTAGALALALPHFDTVPVLVVNGDTFIDADLGAFLQAFREAGAQWGLLSVQVADAGRYGRLDIDDVGRVRSFREKDTSGGGWINAGVYLLGSAALERLAGAGAGSLERDHFQALPPGTIAATRADDARFVDIGTPESWTGAAALIALGGEP